MTIELPDGIYGILGEDFSRGRSNVETAQLMVDAGIDILQYREKAGSKDRRDMLAQCLEIRKITAAARVLFIINDFLDIALLCGADGVHLGQEDLPVARVKAAYPHLMVGCSTHSPEEAVRAVKDGADYLGAGPVFPTRTKADAGDTVGLEYIEYLAASNTIPFAAIGGIKRHNIQEVAARGAKTMCLITEIISAEDIGERIGQIRSLMR
jgi:thiamine-phosphate pyrophosphorylase